jgi:hypothetical protein
VDASVEPDEHAPNRLQRGLLFAIVRDIGLRWTELRAIELAAAEVNEEFDGEDVFAPDLRALLDQAKASLQEIAAGVRPYVVAVETPEPDEDAVALVRKLLHRRAD